MTFYSDICFLLCKSEISLSSVFPKHWLHKQLINDLWKMANSCDSLIKDSLDEPAGPQTASQRAAGTYKRFTFRNTCTPNTVQYVRALLPTRVPLALVSKHPN